MLRFGHSVLLHLNASRSEVVAAWPGDELSGDTDLGLLTFTSAATSDNGNLRRVAKPVYLL